MNQVAGSLRIKYGLAKNPTDTQIAQWAALVRRYQDERYGLEEAGHLTAKYIFRDYQTYFFRSEADSIVALLQAAEKKS